MIAAGTLGGIYISYGRILGRDSGIALLVVMLALKLMEMATLRDAMVLIFIGYFLVITNFLYSQTIPTTVLHAARDVDDHRDHDRLSIPHAPARLSSTSCAAPA